VMCQVADFGGPWIVSWWVVLPSALVAVAWSERDTPRHLVAPSTIVLATLACVAIYGAWRLHTINTIDGPRVIVIQTNISHLPGGAPSVERERSVELLLRQLEGLIGQSVDLAVLPEAALPPINLEARRELMKSPIGPFLDQTNERLLAIARKNHAALLVGGNAVTGWTTRGREHIGTEIRNSVYFFAPQSDASVERY
jgi:apolipoprotein N-acyltransferase